MRTTTSLIHIAALAIAAVSVLGTPSKASADTQVYSTQPCRIVEGVKGCAPDLPSGIGKLPTAVIATKRTVEARGVSQPNLKPSICNVRPDMFKGCQVF